MTAAGLSAEIVRDASALASLESQWWDLWRKSPKATAFQSPAWLIPWWSQFHPGQLLSVAVFRGSALVGFAPLYLEDGPYGRRLLPLGIGISDHLDVLVDPEAGGAGGAMLQALAGEPGWEVLELEELTPGAAGLGLPLLEGWSERVEQQSTCPSLPLSATLDAEGWPAAIPRRRRLDHRRLLRHAQAQGGLDLRQADTPDFLDAVIGLHQARWRARDKPGVLEAPDILQFHHEAFPRLATAGLLDCWLAFISGRVAAAYYGLRWHRVRAYYLGGFDPAFAKAAPMSILIGQAVQAAASGGAPEFSFLRGQEDYKYAWGAADRWNVRRTFRRDAT